MRHPRTSEFHYRNEETRRDIKSDEESRNNSSIMEI